MPHYPCQGSIMSTLDYFLKPNKDHKSTKLDDLLPLYFWYNKHIIDLKTEAMEL